MTRTITPTHVLLSQITLGATTSDVTFSNIPQGYGDLVLVCSLRMSVGKTLGITINDDTGSNYTQVWMRGSGSAASSSSNTFTQYRFMGENVNVSTSDFDNSITSFLDYSATDKHKTMLTRNNQPSASVEAIAGRWANTNAITKLSFAPVGGGSNFFVGCTFSLYGVFA